MRTTIRLDDQLLSEAKKLAVERGTTLTAVLEDALRQTLAQRKQRQKRAPFKLITSGQGGLRPGVDLDNSAALLELMESADDTD